MLHSIRWRLVFSDAVGSNAQWRTNWIVPGGGEDITVVDNGNGTSTYTWTNPGDFYLNPGDTRRIQVRVDNGSPGVRGDIMGLSITNHQPYVTVPPGL